MQSRTCDRFKNSALILGLALSMTGFGVTAAASGGAGVLFVDETASPGGDGSTWNLAYRFPQDALAVAADPVNGIAEIHIAGGLYTPDRTDAIPGGSGNRDATFSLVEGVALRGGFRGANIDGLDPDERGIGGEFETILSGDLATDDATIGDTTDNSYHVVTGLDVGPTTVLDRFTIQGGQSDRMPIVEVTTFDPNNSGGGILLINASPAIGDCTVTGNFALNRGGGLYCHDFSSPMVAGCSFLDNAAGGAGFGGGIASWGLNTLTLTDSNITGNLAELDGGGVHIRGHEGIATAIVTNCQFVGNIGDGFLGGGWYSRDTVTHFDTCRFEGNVASSGAGSSSGAGAYVRGDISEPVATFRNCQFVANTCVGLGGGLLIRSMTAEVTDCHFESNLAGRGGGINGQFGPLTILDSVFLDNEASEGGGLWSRGALDVRRCEFRENRADCPFNACSLGGAVYTSNSTLPGQRFEDCLFQLNNSLYAGGALWVRGQLEILRCDFEDNTSAGGGGGAIIDENLLSTFTSLIIDSNFLRNQSASGGAILALREEPSHVINCVFDSNTASFDSGAARLSGEYTVAGCLFRNNIAATCCGALDIDGDGRVINSTFYGNIAPQGGAIRNDSLVTGTSAIINSILRLNGPNPVQGDIMIANSNLEGGWGGAGSDNIDEDPLFIDPVAGNFRLAAGSTSIDHGDSTLLPPDEFDLDADGVTTEALPLDLDGLPRVRNASVDLGAYESSFCPTDTDGDGKIGVTEFLSILMRWGDCQCPCSSDAEGDGDVGITEFLAVLANWGPCP